MPPTTSRRRTTARTSTARGGRPTAITKLSEGDGYKNWLIVGETGVGKTVLAGTAPKSLFLTFEAEGTESAKVAGSKSDQLIIKTREDWQEAIDYFEYGSGCQDYDWVLPDSISEMEEVFWTSQLRMMKDKKPESRSLYKPALDDYPIVWNQVKAAIDQLNRLPVNVLYTAQIMPLEFFNEDGDEEVEYLPLVGSTKNGVLARKVCGKVSLVGFLEAKSKKQDDEVVEWRRLYVTRRGGMHAKNRYGWGPWVDNPEVPALVQLADTALKGEAPTRTRRSSRRRTA